MKQLLTVLFLGCVTSIASHAHAGCQINLFVKNTGDHQLGIHLWEKSDVKSKGGTWRRLSQGGWFDHAPGTVVVDAGQRSGDNYNATFGCGMKRRYRITYKCTTGDNELSSFTKYYPSSTGWTTKTNITIKLPKCK